MVVIQYGATIFALAAATSFCAFLAFHWIGRICDRVQRGIAERREARLGWQYRSEIASLDRWCCWYFPIVEDICAYLLKPDVTIDQFRERLKSKYGDRSKGEVVSCEPSTK